MPLGFGKRRCEISSVAVVDGAVFCDAEDLDTPGQIYDKILFAATAGSQVAIPQLGTEVIVEEISGEKIITNVLTYPGNTGGSKSDMEAGVADKGASMSFVFGPRDGADGPEKVSMEYRESGYVLDIDIDGDVTINAGGNVQITEGGTPKKVLTEDATFEYEDTDGNGNTSTKTTSKVSNDETTSVEVE